MTRIARVIAILAVAGCTQQAASNIPQTASNAVACAQAVQAAITVPPGMTDAQKGVAAGLAAATTPACIGLTADAIAAMGQLRTATPNVSAVKAPQ